MVLVLFLIFPLQFNIVLAVAPRGLSVEGLSPAFGHSRRRRSRYRLLVCVYVGGEDLETRGFGRHRNTEENEGLLCAFDLCPD